MSTIWQEGDSVSFTDDTGVERQGEVVKAVGREIQVLADGLIFYVNRDDLFDAA